jgi:hypothetical protein
LKLKKEAYLQWREDYTEFKRWEGCRTNDNRKVRNKTYTDREQAHLDSVDQPVGALIAAILRILRYISQSGVASSDAPPNNLFSKAYADPFPQAYKQAVHEHEQTTGLESMQSESHVEPAAAVAPPAADSPRETSVIETIGTQHHAEIEQIAPAALAQLHAPPVREGDSPKNTEIHAVLARFYPAAGRIYPYNGKSPGALSDMSGYPYLLNTSVKRKGRRRCGGGRPPPRVKSTGLTQNFTS